MEGMSVDFVTDYDHGLLVIEQLGSRSTHDDWDVHTEGAHSDGDSVYVSVLPPMEGRVTTSVRRGDVEEPCSENLRLVFEGQLTINSKTLIIGDSDFNLEVRVPVRSGIVDVKVFADAARFASRVLVFLGGQ